DLADDRRIAPAALEHRELGAAALDAGFLERPLHHAVSISAFTEAPELALEVSIEGPDARPPLGRQPQPLQRLESARVHGLPRRVQLLRARGHQDTVLGPGEQSAVQPGEALLLDLAGKLLQALHVALGTELQRHKGPGAGAHAMADVVAGDHQIAALIVTAADHNVRVGVPGIEVVDGHPVEPGVEILLHLPHEVADEGLEIRDPGAVLGRHDEAELMRVAFRAIEERVAVNVIPAGIVEPARLTVAGDTVPLDVAQVRLRRAEVAGALTRVARPYDHTTAARCDQPRAGKDSRCHAAPPSVRRDVAAVPQQAGAGAARLPDDPSSSAKIGGALCVADATELRFKGVVGHDVVPRESTDF